jgi:hypothetical protein
VLLDLAGAIAALSSILSAGSLFETENFSYFILINVLRVLESTINKEKIPCTSKYS